MNSLRINLNILLVKLVLLSPLAMLLQRRIDFINRMLIGFILIVLVVTMIKQGIRRYDFIVIMISMTIFLFSIFDTRIEYFSANMLFYYPLWVFYLIYVKQSYEAMIEAFHNCEGFIRIVIWTWCILVGISAVLPSSYVNREFQSFSNGNFRFAQTVFFMAILIWMYAGMFKKKKYMYLIFITLLAMIATGSRTYTIILLIMIALSFYSFFEKKRYFFLLIVPTIVISIALLQESVFINKFEHAINNAYVNDPLAALTSNRSVFWIGELRLFMQAGPIEKLFGGGLTSSYVKNVVISHQAIWAHNDFLEVLNAHGMCGLIFYFIPLCGFISAVKKKNQYTFIQFAVFLLCPLLNAFFNGLYVYTVAMLAVPLLSYAVKVDFSRYEMLGQ